MAANGGNGARVLSLLADLLSTVFERRERSRPDQELSGRSIEDLSRALLGEMGEISGMAIASRILDLYEAMEPVEKAEYFQFLTRKLDIKPADVRISLSDYEMSPDRTTYAALMAAVEPKRQELARRLNQVPGATGRLVAMRADLLGFARRNPAFGAVDLDLRHLFASWFNRGFLVLRPVNWETPAHILEKITAYEAVHAIENWDDLRRRVQPADRRCFAFFHPAMPSEPLIFVEVALTKGIPDKIQTVLAEDRQALEPEDTDTAVFYSISNCQAGLAGISFGDRLIKQVVEDLSRELPELKTFVTLSPIPGLVDWLKETETSVDAEDEEAVRTLAARYLLNEKQTGRDTPRDPVARFHLGNGARVHAVHAMADLSANGRAQSAGAMVNYLYDLTEIAGNHEGFASVGRIAASAEVTALAQQQEK